MAFSYRSDAGPRFGVNHCAGLIVLFALVVLFVMNRAFATISVGIG